MREQINRAKHLNPKINYRGLEASRVDNLTDAVFGIAITLLIFNLKNPNSFETLLQFTQTLPAFLLSIGFIILIWKEHLVFSRVFAFNDGWLLSFNTLFLALVIFYVYPLRFLTVFLTNFFFNSGVDLALRFDQVPDLMIYYGLIVAALYLILLLMHGRVLKIATKMDLSEFEATYTKAQFLRILIMMGVPLVSVLVTALLKNFSVSLASILGGMAYNLYVPTMIWWSRKFKHLD